MATLARPSSAIIACSCLTASGSLSLPIFSVVVFFDAAFATPPPLR
jgi:hypothetical protein